MTATSFTFAEAKERLGYEFMATVLHHVRRGGLKLTPEGMITAKSLEALRLRKEANAERSALFQRATESLSPAEKAVLQKSNARFHYPITMSCDKPGCKLTEVHGHLRAGKSPNFRLQN